MYKREEIQERVVEIAREISENHNHPTPPLMICLLKGGFMFFSDLVKNMSLLCDIDFIKVNSYDGTESKDIKISLGLDTGIMGRNIYLVDDILDSGKTMNYLVKELFPFNPSSINLVTMFKRYNSPKIENHIYGFELDNDDFIYGYGMNDLNGLGRNLDYVDKINILK